jgi:adhesin/invasin
VTNQVTVAGGSQVITTNDSDSDFTRINQTNSAEIGLSPASLQFASTAGVNPPPQTFQVENLGTGTLGWTATVATESGGNWLQASPTTGVATSTVTVTANSASLPTGSYTGRVTIAALPGIPVSNSPKILPVELNIGIPVISTGGVVNAASYSTDGINSPGAITALFGFNLASGTQAATQLPLPLTMAGTQVLVGGTPAPLFFVSPMQINFQIPNIAVSWFPFPTVVDVVVVANGVQSRPAPLPLFPASPGVFTTSSDGRGHAAALNYDLTPNSSLNPASAGSVIVIYLTGMGAVTPPLQAGYAAADLNLTALTPTVLIGGLPADVQFSGAAPGFAGLYQINARIPVTTSSGNAVSLEIRANGRVSNAVTIAVK